MSDNAPVPKWFRFKPTGEELITRLNLKTQGKESELDSHIAEIDHICKWEPWELPFMSKMDPNNGEWWFLCRPDYKNSHSNRSNRRTKTGHWKITGKERNIKDCNGRKRILVFYEGPSPGKRTDWVLHEYYSLQPNISVSLQKSAYVICQLKRKYHEKGDTPDCSECELSPTSEMASDLGNSLVSAPTTPVNNFISSPQHQLCSPELCNIVQALFDEDMPEFSCDKIEKCYGEFLNLVSAHPGEYNSGETNITYNSPNMSDSSKSSYVDGPVSNDTHTIGVKERVNHHRSLAVG
ncbi:NAC domain-containing protein 14-like isoform X2 [Humulus lupulus]|uniref:NAC domain-containing protein 14-like isoform X2 n=1 Tax=Humulus lupulus TaxID=3486 RepID=UPI002B40A2CC|nr:NAC domain-containing protein 14-like isoform X2 [Humulus lupulus]